MNAERRTGHSLLGRTARAVTVAAAAALGAVLPGCKGRTRLPAPTAPVADRPERQEFVSSGAKPRPAGPRRPEPHAEEERAKAIRRTADALRAECRRAAGGDWDRWERDTAPYRAALRAKLDALQPVGLTPRKIALPEEIYEPLEGKNGFPLFETDPRTSLNYLYDPAALEPFGKGRSVALGNRWLRRRGIDLIFVPVPSMTEVYVEHFLDPCPPDGVVGPHVRRMLLELLDEGVEVVDGLPLFRSRRDDGPEYLYHPADSHWGPRAMRIMAKELADRIARYRFGAEARAAAPVVMAAVGPYEAEPGDGWSPLNGQQRKRAEGARIKNLPHVTTPDGRRPPDDRDSPVLLVGHSYVEHFREQLIRELNLLIQTRWAAGRSTECFADFLREPEVLDQCRVVIWVSSDRYLPLFRALPPAVASEAASD
jgi:hypothetical protein